MQFITRLGIDLVYLLLLLLLLVCYPGVSTSQSSCRIIGDDQRIDCHPGPNMTEQVCRNRGCCYMPSTSGISAPVPLCFYPIDYPGYRVTSMKRVKGGRRYFLTRTERSYVPDEIMDICADILYVSESIVRVRITDPNDNRFEVPYIFNVSQIDEPLSNAFDIKVTNMPFTVRIMNRVTKECLLDSSIGPLLYADQFLQISTKLSNNYLYGIGEHRNPLRVDVGWQTTSFWNRDQPPVINHNLYGSHPFAMMPGKDGKNHYGLFLLNANAMETVLQPMPALTFRTIGGIIDLFVYAGPTPQDVIRQHWTVIKLPHFQPYWAMGFHLCRYGYRTITEMREVMARMKSASFQYDVQWTDIDAMRNKLVFTYDDVNWRGLPELVKELHSQDMRYTPINDPCIGLSAPGAYPALDEGLKLDVFIRNEKGELLIGRVWPGDCYFPDFTSPNAVKWWAAEIDKFNTTAPFDGFWIDMNEPANFVHGSTTGCGTSKYDQPWYVPNVIGGNLYDKTVCPSATQVMSNQYNLHNLYGFIESKVTFEAIAAITPTKRHFVLSRSTFSGSGYYAGHWSGDNWSTWNDLYNSIPEMLTFNMYGMPFVGADICGFFENTNEELCMRWMQLGAFYPFMRNHNTIDMVPQDPAAFSQPARQVMKDALLIRYRLMPYWYTLNYKSHSAYSTVMTPMFFLWPSDEVCQRLDTQFLLGEALMVAPVLTEKATEMYVYMPDDGGERWYDYYTNAAVGMSYEQWNKVPVKPETLGLYWRSGFVIPMHDIDITKNAIQNQNSHFTLKVTLSKYKMSYGELYWDDGETKEGDYVMVSFSGFDGHLTISPTSRTYTRPLMLSEVHVLGLDRTPNNVMINGKMHSDYTSTPHLLTIRAINRDMNDGNTMMITYQ